MKRRVVGNCYECARPCGRNENYDLENLWIADEDSRSLRSLILFGIRGVAAYAYHTWVLGCDGARPGGRPEGHSRLIAHAKKHLTVAI